MISQEEKKQIAELVKSGIGIDMVAFELEISEEEVQRYVDEISELEKIEKAGMETKVQEITEEVKIQDVIEDNKKTEVVEDKEIQNETKISDPVKIETVTKSEEPKKSVSKVKKPRKRVAERKAEKILEVVKKPEQPRAKSVKKEDTKSYKGKMAVVRRKYQELYNGKSSRQNDLDIKVVEPTKEEFEKVEEIIAKLEEGTNGLEKLTAREKLLKGNNVLEVLKDFYSLPCSLEQAYRVRKLVSNRELNELKLDLHDRIDQKIDKARVIVNRKLADIIETEAAKADDYDTVFALLKKISYDMEKKDASVTSLKLRIQSKLNYLMQSRAVDRFKNDISDEVRDITRGIIEPNADVEEIETKIDKEAQRLFDSAPKKGFLAIKRESYDSQVYMKIRTLLSDRAEEFKIEDSDLVIDRLMKVCNGDFHSSLKCIVDNFVSRKDYDGAKAICSKYIQKPNKDTFEEPEKSVMARKMKKQIVGTEIGDMVLNQINTRAVDDGMFMKLLEDRLESERANLSLISLGKTRMGTKTISLNDVWYEQRNR